MDLVQHRERVRIYDPQSFLHLVCRVEIPLVVVDLLDKVLDKEISQVPTSSLCA